MRLLRSFLWLCLPLAGYAQNTNSLLWEISGNGLQKPSYLYGTMHVSKKIAFLLDDVFYEALDQSEVIALESDPATWLESDTRNNNSGYGFNPKGFYEEAFVFPSPNKKDLATFLASDDDLVNNILYRTNEYAQDYEEETYLDMFIYQAGSKFGKSILALEDLEESQALVGRASLNAMKRKPDEWLQEKMEQFDLMSLMQDAYRERNIALLDSIDRAMYTDHYLNNMLYIRNEHMARRLDSAMQRHKVFAGIGAAHLPGKKGVLALLQEKGYQVRPLVSGASEQGARMKEKFVKSFRKPELKPQGPEDHFFSIRLPHKLYPVVTGQHTTYISPDLTNGSYFMVHRIPTRSYLNPTATYSIDDLEGLLFENIPGKILEKKRIVRQGFQGLDIRNQLKDGDLQRYQIFTTPLEILVFKMAGQGHYVDQYSGPIFNSLEFKPLKEGKVHLTSAFRDFEVKVPAYYSFPNQDRIGSRRLEGYNPAGGSYFFLEQANLNDFDFIEKDQFELKQIQQRFYQQQGLQPEFDPFVDQSLTSSAPLKDHPDQKLYLKTQIRRGEYYLLGILTRDPEEAQTYFDSFQLHEPRYPEAFKTIRDTALYFSTVSPVAPRKFVETNLRSFKSQNQVKSYDPYTKKTVYQHADNEAILVTLNKSHDYMTFPGIDSLWALRKKQYSEASFRIRKEKEDRLPDGSRELQLLLTDTASSRGVLVKNIVKGGLLYELKANVDTLGQGSRFVTEFFDHFQPLDTLIGRDMMEDKVDDFFAALRSNDSIVMKGYRYLLFDERHADKLMDCVSNFDFSGDKEHIQSYLLKQLGHMDLPRVQAFLNRYYADSYGNSGAQARILQATAEQPDAPSVDRLLSLMARDLPLVANPSEIERIFAPFYDQPEQARKLFPELLEYASITEYREPIISLLASLVSSGDLAPKRYKKYLGPLVQDANLQLKRQLGVENQSKMQNSKFNKNNQHHRELLDAYTMLLFPFRDKKETAPFFARLFQVRDAGVRTTYFALLATEHARIPGGSFDSLAADLNSRGLLFRKLEAVGEESLFPQKYGTRQQLAAAELYEGDGFEIGVDTVRYIKSQDLRHEGKNFTGYYFMTRNEKDFNKNFKMCLLVYPADAPIGTEASYRNRGFRLADTDTEEEAIRYVTEEFILNDHPRSEVFEPTQKIGYGL